MTTDEEFFTSLKAMREDAKHRRQEALSAADVERFKEWDYIVGALDTLIGRRESAQTLRTIKGEAT